MNVSLIANMYMIDNIIFMDTQITNYWFSNYKYATALVISSVQVGTVQVKISLKKISHFGVNFENVKIHTHVYQNPEQFITLSNKYEFCK